MALHVLPDPNPWNKSKLLYGVWKDKKFLTNNWFGDNSNSAFANISACSLIFLWIVPSYLVSLNSFFIAIFILKFLSFKSGYRYGFSFSCSLK
jgi:hypothetical protein